MQLSFVRRKKTFLDVHLYAPDALLLVINFLPDSGIISKQSENYQNCFNNLSPGSLLSL